MLQDQSHPPILAHMVFATRQVLTPATRPK
jgi:hypothetical protein